MKISDLLNLELGESVSISNTPFTYIGRANILLKDGSKVFWLYDDKDCMLTISPEQEELMLFQQIQEEIEPSETILYQSKEYEFSYEDGGVVKLVEGESMVEEEDRNAFSDYQSSDGETVRLITNENTGEAMGYAGRVVLEDDILEI